MYFFCSRILSRKHHYMYSGCVFGLLWSMTAYQTVLVFKCCSSSFVTQHSIKVYILYVSCYIEISRILWSLPPTPCPLPAFCLWKNFTKVLIGEVKYMMTRLYLWHKLPQFQELASRRWGQINSENWRIAVSKTTKMMLVRLLMTNFKMTSELTMLFLHGAPLHQTIKVHIHWSSKEEGGLWIDVLPPSPLPRPSTGIWNKANFPFHLVSLLVFE